MEILKNGQWRNLYRDFLGACLLGFVFLIQSASAADKFITLDAPLSVSGYVPADNARLCQSMVDYYKSTPNSFGSGYTFISYNPARCWDQGGTMRVEIQYSYCGSTTSCLGYRFMDWHYVVSSTGPSCPADFNYDSASGRCLRDCAKIKGQSYSTTILDSKLPDVWKKAKPAAFCLSHCRVINLYWLKQPAQSTQFGDYWITGGDFDGNVCSDTTAETSGVPDQSDRTDTPESDCIKKGKSYGYVNGFVVCVPPKESTTSKNASSTETAEDGSKTEKETSKTTTQNPDGTVTETTTTTTTTTNASGTASTSSSSSSKTEKQSEYCAENPSSNLCEGEGGSFTGSCTSGFKCDGDAVQCAIAREQHIRNCKLFEEKTALSDLGDQLTAGQDPNADDSPFSDANKRKFDFAGGDGQIDQTRLWGGQCIPPQSFSVFGRSYTIDTTKLCETIALFGNLFVAVSLLGAVRIVGSGA